MHIVHTLLSSHRLRFRSATGPACGFRLSTGLMAIEPHCVGNILQLERVLVKDEHCFVVRRMLSSLGLTTQEDCLLSY